MFVNKIMFKNNKVVPTPSKDETPLSPFVKSGINVQKIECEIIKKDSFYNFIKSDIRTYRI